MGVDGKKYLSALTTKACLTMASKAELEQKIQHLKNLIRMQLDYSTDMTFIEFQRKYGDISREDMYDKFREALKL